MMIYLTAHFKLQNEYVLYELFLWAIGGSESEPRGGSVPGECDIWPSMATFVIAGTVV